MLRNSIDTGERAGEPIQPYSIPKSIPFFIGRKDQINAIMSFLAKGANVASIIGASGQGKTVLMLKIVSEMQTSGELQDLFPHGVVHLDFYENPGIQKVLTPLVHQYRPFYFYLVIF